MSAKAKKVEPSVNVRIWKKTDMILDRKRLELLRKGRKMSKIALVDELVRRK